MNETWSLPSRRRTNNYGAVFKGSRTKQCRGGVILRRAISLRVGVGTGL